MYKRENTYEKSLVFSFVFQFYVDNVIQLVFVIGFLEMKYIQMAL